MLVWVVMLEGIATKLLSVDGSNLPSNRDLGSREQGAGSREQGAGSRVESLSVVCCLLSVDH